MKPQEYPRAFIIRTGADAGKVIIQWGPRSPLTLVDETGRATERNRFPDAVLAPTVSPLRRAA